MKTCSVCQEQKDRKEFQKRAASIDGLTGACKDCLHDRDRKRYPKEREKRMQQHKEYIKTSSGRAAAKRAYTKHNKSPLHLLSVQLWRKCNPEKVRTHGVLNYRIKTGEVVRPDHCERCQAECVPHGHHDDYSKPLDVTWLCVPCHKLEHAI